MVLKISNLFLYFVFLIIAIGVAFSIQFNKNIEFISTILGVVTFLFGLFLAFSLSDRRDRLDRIRGNSSMERSQMIFLFKASKVFGKDFQKRMLKAIDNYLMVTLDYKIWDYEKTGKSFDKLVDVASSARTDNVKKQSLYGYFLEVVNNLGIARKASIGLIEDKLSIFEWFVFILFSGIIVLSLITLNLGTPLTISLVGALILSIILLLVLLYRLNNLSWKEEMRIFEPYEKAFESLGLLRYYPEVLIRKGRVNKYKNHRCRVGIFPNPYPDLRGKKIKIIDFKKMSK